MIRLRVRGLELALLMALFSALAALFLYVIGADALQELHPFQFFADSNTYHRTYAGEATNFEGALIGVDSNYLGPLTVLQLLSGNIYLVMLLNVYLFTHSVLHITRQFGMDPLRVAALLMLSPLTVSSLLSVNKEIFLFPFLAFALNAYLRRSWLSMLLALACSVLVRWQLAGFYVLMLLLSGPLRVVRSRAVVIGALLVAISLAYRLVQPLIEPILAYVQHSIEIYEGGGSGVFEQVLNLQNVGLYVLVFPVKAFHLLFGMGFKLDKIVAPVEIYNDLFVSGHCAVAFLTFLALAKRRMLTLRSDWMFVALVFLAVFCATPVFAPRYLYFVFVLAIFVLAGAPQDLGRARIAGVAARRRRVRLARPAAASLATPGLPAAPIPGQDPATP